MTVASDPVNFQSIAPQPVRTLDGGRMMWRGFQGMIGSALVLSAIGLWFAPGANWGTNLMLMKLLYTAGAGMAGIAFLQGFGRPNAPKVEIDTIRHEVRLVRVRGRARFVLDRCAFKDLTHVKNCGAHVELWGRKNVLLAEVAASDRVSHRSLVTALRVAGKL